MLPASNQRPGIPYSDITGLAFTDATPPPVKATKHG
jgi:hypothetical protein